MIDLVIMCLVLLGFFSISLIGSISSSIDNMLKAKDEQSKNKLIKKQQELKARLSAYIKIIIPDEITSKIKEVDFIEQELRKAIMEFDKIKFNKPHWKSLHYEPIKLFEPREANNSFFTSDITTILTPTVETWGSKENMIINQVCEYPVKSPDINNNCIVYPKHLKEISVMLNEAQFLFGKVEVENVINKDEIKELFNTEYCQVDNYNKKMKEILIKISQLNDSISSFNKALTTKMSEYQLEIDNALLQARQRYEEDKVAYEQACASEKERINSWLNEYKLGTKEAVEQRINNILSSLFLPNCIPLDWSIEFDEAEKIAIVEVQLPNVIHSIPLKMVSLKKRNITKQINKQEQKTIVPSIHPAILLRFAYEIYRDDFLSKIELLALNGWVKYDDPRTGIATKAYTASFTAKRDEILCLNLVKVDPLAAFNNLKGIATGNVTDIIPITPVLKLNKTDSRFVEAKPVIDALKAQTNLASMDWQDFEHLIRELFERVFIKDGVEVKITQASRDRGVDAVIFNPDPIKGGKYIVQAKRYTNTVDVSAVRDLCAVVSKEGASRGILVTTSKFGADAYEFAKGIPITLLNGSELLGLLKQHGYTFRIDMEEAKLINR